MRYNLEPMEVDRLMFIHRTEECGRSIPEIHASESRVPGPVPGEAD